MLTNFYLGIFFYSGQELHFEETVWTQSLGRCSVSRKYEECVDIMLEMDMIISRTQTFITKICELFNQVNVKSANYGKCKRPKMRGHF